MLVPRRLATALPWCSDDIRAAVATGAPAKRVFALGLMQAKPELTDIELILECIAHSNSTFEQFLDDRLSPSVNVRSHRPRYDALDPLLSPHRAHLDCSNTVESCRELARGKHSRQQIEVGA